MRAFSNEADINMSTTKPSALYLWRRQEAENQNVLFLVSHQSLDVNPTGHLWIVPQEKVASSGAHSTYFPQRMGKDNPGDSQKIVQRYAATENGAFVYK